MIRGSLEYVCDACGKTMEARVAEASAPDGVDVVYPKEFFGERIVRSRPSGSSMLEVRNVYAACSGSCVPKVLRKMADEYEAAVARLLEKYPSWPRDTIG